MGLSSHLKNVARRRVLISPLAAGQGCRIPTPPACRLLGTFSAYPQKTVASTTSFTRPASLWLCQTRFFGTVKKIPVPSMGDSITEGVVNSWKKNPGDWVARDECVVVLDSDKVSVDVNAPFSGIIKGHLAKVDDVVPVGQDLFELEEAEAPAAGTVQTSSTSEPKAPSTGATKQPPKSTEAAPPKQPTKSSTSAPAKSPAQKAPPAPAVTKPSPVSYASTREVTRSTMTPIRRRIAERLKSSQNTAASLTTFNECDMSGLIAMRGELNEEFVKKHGYKMGFVSPFLFAASRSLMNMSCLNAYVEGNEIVSHNFVDISVAVATPNGLLVPVVRDCEKKTISELEQELQLLAKKGREGKIALEDMLGGTHTISNGGVFGSLLGTPILNPPQSSILGLHGTKQRPVVVDGQIVIRPMMYLALTYDHRIVDGAEAVQFLNSIKQQIEDPRRMLLQL